MRKLTLLALLLTIGLGFSQSKKTLKRLAEIQGEWTANDKGIPEYIKISENLDLSKEELYNQTMGHLKKVLDLYMVLLVTYTGFKHETT